VRAKRWSGLAPPRLPPDRPPPLAALDPPCIDEAAFRKRHRMAEVSEFYQAWSRHWLHHHAAPSERALAVLVGAEISCDIGPVIQLGAGVGALTSALIASGIKQEDLALVELGSDFAIALQFQYPRARTLWMDAASLRKVVIFEGRPAGAVISQLTLSTMPSRKVGAILTSAFDKMGSCAAFYQFAAGPRCPICPHLLKSLGLRAQRIRGKSAARLTAPVYQVVRASNNS